MLGTVVSIALAPWVALVLSSGPGVVRYDGQSVVRVQPRDAGELSTVRALARDVWAEGVPRLGTAFDVVVDDTARAVLEARGVAFDVRVPDLQLLVDLERDRIAAAGSSTRADWFAEYRSLDAIHAYMDWLAEVRPDVVTVVELDGSLQGRPIRGLLLSAGDQPLPEVLVTGTQHAREWISPMVTMCIADRLARGHGDDPAATLALERADWSFVPVVNPDGYVHSWTAERFWRKNMRDGVGVDLNRNWGEGWGTESGSSDEPEDGNYRGTAPFSEPETAAVRDFVLTRPAIAAHVDLHAYSQLVLYPYSYTYDPPEAFEDLEAWAFGLGDVLESVHGTEYRPLWGPDFYFAAGTAPDWTVGELGAFAFTIELRPSYSEEFELGFVLPSAQIVPTCEEVFVGMLELGRWLDEGGPDPIPGPNDGGGEETDDGEPPPDVGESGESGETGETGDEGEAGDGTSETHGSIPDEGGCGCDVSERASAFMWALLPLAGRRRHSARASG
jgi:hypothetical protein